MRSNASVLILAIALAACGGTRESLGATLPYGAYGRYQDTGLASWYGEELSGNRTASGEVFDASAITAAHRTLPLGSFAEVTSLDTGRSILVRITDRGPGRRDRIIDLSRGAARLLGTDRRPVANVRVRAVVPSSQDAATLRAGRSVAARDPGFVRASAVSLPERRPVVLVPGHTYVLQIATFSNEARARALADRLDARVVGGGGLWRVRLGPFDDAGRLQRARDAVAERGYGDAQVLPGD
ncbi:septal ring lytic transglycosylase RlpA family protein [Sphingomonas ginsenosidivorax]|uniref:Endolytic peptidoglycan transglycosylase RlpA n=1 Tax=Sphingomonas ginsenosidivorax TaxID=862135 RepID=A0A5C6UE99_9SPHN|nr:septal ring lytic transglycosylase RlpA family protein [Sphingomonas ginsenosidivorax]TXC70541.1 septal ring lytic transglycosylase RlpA family protein [Sphingomonas ginsenosidivorax]